MLGSQIDKYEILNKIGDGGMATVYRGRHVTLGRDVAVKILHPHLSASPRNRTRFAREARAIEHLDHDNIVKIFDYSGTDAEDCYIVTEFVDGANLQQILVDKGRMPSEVVSIVGVRLARALQYAHSQSIIHRDLKPENVMVRVDGTVKLMDFGIARFMDESHLTMTGALVGSPAYMSPEQAMEQVLDARSDLFSLGTLLFHLATGQLPFSGGNPSIVLRNIIEGNRPEVIELAPGISGTLADIIEGLLQLDPADRPGSAESVIPALRRSLDEVGVDDSQADWALRSWLMDSDAYERRLTEHLGAVLLAEGRRRLAERDHLGALRLFNRLLTLDEDNEEVLALVQGMHSESGPSGRGWTRGLAAVLLAAAAGLLTWTFWPEEPVEPGSVTMSLPPAQEPEVAAAEPVVGEQAVETPGPEDVAPQDVAVELGASVVSAQEPRPPRQIREVLPVPVLPAADPAMGSVTVSVKGSWGEIFIDGIKKGKTGTGPIELEPGKHILTLKNPVAEDYTEEFRVASGESVVLKVAELHKKPAIAVLAARHAESCQVSLNGIPQGTVGDLGRRVVIRDVDKPQTFLFEGCPGSDPYSVVLDSVAADGRPVVQ